jgi:hypothetical protein
MAINKIVYIFKDHYFFSFNICSIIRKNKKTRKFEILKFTIGHLINEYKESGFR